MFEHIDDVIEDGFFATEAPPNIQPPSSYAADEEQNYPAAPIKIEAENMCGVRIRRIVSGISTVLDEGEVFVKQACFQPFTKVQRAKRKC